MTTVRGHYRFTVKERSDRSPWIAAEPAGDIIPGMGDLGAGGAVGAPAGVPGAAGNTSPTFRPQQCWRVRRLLRRDVQIRVLVRALLEDLRVRLRGPQVPWHLGE
jgi:hypothetical protein